MAITGHLDRDGHDLVLVRNIPAPRPQLWALLADPDLLATWFGTYTGDPSTGHVQVTMTAEPGEAAAAEYTIHACEPSELLTVSSSMGESTWKLSVELADIDADADADADAGPASRAAAAPPVGTHVALRHHDVPADMIQHIGPGWEWYLDRLVGVVTGGEVPDMDVWDSRYMTLSDDYAALRA